MFYTEKNAPKKTALLNFLFRASDFFYHFMIVKEKQIVFLWDIFDQVGQNVANSNFSINDFLCYLDKKEKLY